MAGWQARSRLLGAVMVCGVILSGCGGGTDETSPAAQRGTADDAASPTGAAGGASKDGTQADKPAGKREKESRQETPASPSAKDTPAAKEDAGEGSGERAERPADRGSREDAPTAESAPPPEEPAKSPASSSTWTPESLISPDLAPAKGYAVAHTDSELTRPSLTDPCGETKPASEGQREERKLVWWSPDGTTKSFPLVSMDAISYPDAGVAKAALQEIRDQANSCGERTYEDDTKLQLTLGEVDGLLPDSVVLWMELANQKNSINTGVIYQRTGNLVLATWAIHDLTDEAATAEATELITTFARTYAKRAGTGP